MRITLYKTLLDKEHRTPCLVKETATNYGGDKLSTPLETVQMLRDVFNHDLETEEVVYLLCLGTKHNLLGVFQLSKGTDNYSVMNPREIFMKALMCGANKIIIAHNHPTGNATPSEPDRQSTQRIKDAGDLLGVKLLDSIVVGNNEYFSFREEGAL